MSKKKARLRNFIDKFEPKELAEKLGVDRSTISHWRSGRVLPKPEQMLTIKELSGGELLPDHMIEDYFSIEANRGKYAK